MARGKKEKLSLEELVEQAVVKNEEQLYEVPNNWSWTRLKYIVDINPGKVNVKEIDDNTEVSFIPMSSVSDKLGCIIQYETRILGEVKKGYTNFKSGDVLFAKITPCMENGKAAIVGELINDLGYGSTEFHVLRATKGILNKYIYYLVRYEGFREEAKKNMSGSVGQQRVPKQFLEEYRFPLPPIAEQQRIVDRIESLFEKLDTAKELAQNALDSFENRKAAILHKAFTGELTAKWRKENGVSLDSWEEKKLKEVCNFRAGYAFDSKKFTDTGYQVIRMGNLYNGILDLTRNPVYWNRDNIEESVLKKSKINKGDILLTLTGTKYKRDYGYAVLIETEQALLLNQRIVALTPTKISTKFLLNYLRTNLFRDVFFSNETGGVNQGNVSSKFVENILIQVPQVEEQREIDCILDSVLNNEQQAQELCNVIEKIDLMKKAILARAFRGELGTNNPEEESAMELLKEVLKEKL